MDFKKVPILNWVLGIYFLLVGISHFIVPEGLPGPMSWMYDLSDTLHAVSGTAEILGGLGLILPGLTGIRPELTWMAAAGLTLVMIGATIWHLTRGEIASVVQTVILAGLLARMAMKSREAIGSMSVEAPA